MADAIRDENHEPVMLALSYVDGVTPVPLKIDSSTGGIMIDQVNSAAGVITNRAGHDNNHLTTLTGVSSADSTTVIPLYANPATGALLVDIA